MATTRPTKPQRYKRDALDYAPARAVLITVGRFNHLTAKQVTRALFSERSHTYTQRFLHLLTKDGYLAQSGKMLSTLNDRGTPATLWSPTMKGVEAMLRMGEIPPHRSTSIPKINNFAGAHLSAVNDFLIGVDLLDRDNPRVRLRRMLHQEYLHRNPTRVTLPNGDKVNVEPDAFVELEVDGRPAPFCLELDRGSEHRTEKWVPKIRGLLAYGAGPFREALGVDQLVIAVVVRVIGRPHSKTDPERLEDLLKWTEAELAAINRRNWGPFFQMTVWDGTLSPAEFLGSPRWQSPFDRTPKPLIPQLGGAA